MSEPADHEADAIRDTQKGGPGTGPLGSSNGSHEAVPMAADGITFELCTMMAERLDVPISKVLGIVQIIEEEVYPSDRRRNDDDESRSWKFEFLKILRYLWANFNVLHFFAVLYVFDVREMDDIYGNLTQQQFAEKMGVTRALINIYCNRAAKHFGRPPRQRDMDARQSMRDARLDQLKQNGAVGQRSSPRSKWDSNQSGLMLTRRAAKPPQADCER